MLKPSQNAYNLIKRFEGLRLKAYKCPAGKYTIGYGHTYNVKPNQVITVNEAENLLIKDVNLVYLDLSYLIKTDLNQNQTDAIISFAYNIGIGNFGSSTLLKKINSGKLDEVPAQLLKWVYAGKKIMKGLVNRRRAEAELFIKL